jgi:hypothetical protein
MAAKASPRSATVGLFSRRLKNRPDAKYFPRNFLPLWRIGASGALTWYVIGLAVSWATYMLAGMAAAEFVINYLFTPVALWFAAVGISSILSKGLVVADVDAEGLGLAWGPPGLRKRVHLPYSAIEKITIARWKHETPAVAHGKGRGPGRLRYAVEGFSPRFILREAIEIAHLVQLPKASEPNSSKKALVASDDGREILMYGELNGGYAPFAEALGKYIEVQFDHANEPSVPRWEKSDYLLSVLLCVELAWIAWRIFG